MMLLKLGEIIILPIAWAALALGSFFEGSPLSRWTWGCGCESSALLCGLTPCVEDWYKHPITGIKSWF